MFVVLLLLYSFDELEGAAINVLAPEIRRTFHISSGTIVFIASASSAFFVLGAVPMGWLADRVKRVPIVGWASLAFGFFVFALRSRGRARSCCSGRASPPASPRPTASPSTSRSSPTTTRSASGPGCRPSSTWAATASAWSARCCAPPSPRGRVASRAGGGRGSCSASRWSCVAVLAFFMKEPPRGQFEKQDVLGEVIEDEQPAPISMEAAFARIKRIRTIRTVLVGVLCPRVRPVQPARARIAVPRRQPARARACSNAGIILSLSGILALPILPFVGRYFDKRYREDPATRAGAGRTADPAVGAAHPAAVQRAELHLVLDPEDPAGGAHRVGVRDGGPGAPGGGAVPAARHGHRHVDAVHLLHRWLHGWPRVGLPHRRHRGPGHRDLPRCAQRASSAGCC